MDDLTFERDVLTRAAATMAFPPPPQLRARVVAAIAAEPTARERRAVPLPGMVRFAALATAIAVLVAVTLSLVLPGPRGAVADFFGIGGSKIEVLPTPHPPTTPTPFPTPAGLESYATPSSLDAAALAIGFSPAVPPGEGAPDETFVVDYFDVRVAVLHYARFDLWESRDIGFFLKGVPADLTIRDFEINGRPATLIHGGAHIARFIGADGTEVAGSLRTVDRTTLIWDGARNRYRLESDLPEADIVRIAESLP